MRPVLTTRTAPVARRTSTDLRVGFVPLLDAAPLIAAQAMGYFADEGLRVTLERQIGWGNVRDKLVYGHLHASHALVGMPPASLLGGGGFPEPLAAIMALGFGGDAITIAPRLAAAGLDPAAALRLDARHRGAGGRAMLAHVFGCSSHHYLLRAWLSDQGLDPDRDVRLCVLPPPQMTRQLQLGTLDGFCAGEPWNTVAEHAGLGRIVALTVDIVPEHPEKVLAVGRRWLTAHESAAEALVRATLRGCAFCADPAHAGEVAQLLARPSYVDQPADVLLRSLALGRTPANGSVARTTPTTTSPARSCAPGPATFPAATHAAWLLTQMERWGHLPAGTDILAIAQRSVATAPYRRAAERLNVACPGDDLPPMRLRNGRFDPSDLNLAEAQPPQMQQTDLDRAEQRADDPPQIADKECA